MLAKYLGNKEQISTSTEQDIIQNSIVSFHCKEIINA